MKKIFTSLMILFAFGCSATSQHGTIGARHDLPYSEKLIAYSGDFMGMPYAIDPLGEGVGFDSDPIYDFNKFDCVTYIETVIALANAKDFDDFVHKKKNISYYDGHVDYVNRKHFFEIDHEQDLNDITGDLGIKTKNITGVINRKNWLLKKNSDLTGDFTTKNITLKYIDKNDIFEIDINKLGPISVVGIVMKNPESANKVGSDVLLAHTGFLIKNNEHLEIWHASSTAGKVIKQDFFKYVSDMKNSATRTGVKVWQIKKMEE